LLAILLFLSILQLQGRLAHVWLLIRNKKLKRPIMKNSKHHFVHNTARNGYEAKVIKESLQRAGRNPQLKGIIHEILIKDTINANPANIVNGVKATLTKSTNAKTVDIVVRQGGKIVQRIQAKDTVASVSKTVRQIKSGQYNSAKILASIETFAKLTEKAAKEGIKKTIKSSGISSNTTQAIAVKAGVTSMNGVSKACMAAAKGSAATGAIVGTGFAVFQGIKGLYNDEKVLGEVMLDVGKEAAGGALSAAGASAAATVGGAAVACGLASAGIVGTTALVATVAAPVVIAVGVGFAIKSVWDSIFD